MALTDDSMVMPVTPMYNNGGDMGFGGNGWWILLLLLFAGGGWGNGFGGFGGDGLYPWMNQAGITNGGFQNAATNSAISSLQNSVTTGFGDVQNSLCSGFAGVNATVNNGFSQAEVAENSRQMANMNQMFGIQSALQNCCCENRAGIADLKYTVAQENCADRTQSMQNTRDIMENCNRNNQAILDKLCQLELDGVKAQVEAKNDRISELQNQLNMATIRESQTAQNAFIQQGLTNEVDALYNRLSNCPVPTTPVYGRTPIFTCNNGCGCNQF